MERFDHERKGEGNNGWLAACMRELAWVNLGMPHGNHACMAACPPSTRRNATHQEAAGQACSWRS